MAASSSECIELTSRSSDNPGVREDKKEDNKGGAEGPQNIMSGSSLL